MHGAQKIDVVRLVMLYHKSNPGQVPYSDQFYQLPLLEAKQLGNCNRGLELDGWNYPMD